MALPDIHCGVALLVFRRSSSQEKWEKVSTKLTSVTPRADASGRAGKRAARVMKALEDAVSVTFCVRKAPTTESSTEPPHGCAPGFRSPSTPLRYAQHNIYKLTCDGIWTRPNAHLPLLQTV